MCPCPTLNSHTPRPAQKMPLFVWDLTMVNHLEHQSKNNLLRKTLGRMSLMMSLTSTTQNWRTNANYKADFRTFSFFKFVVECRVPNLPKITGSGNNKLSSSVGEVSCFQSTNGRKCNWLTCSEVSILYFIFYQRTTESTDQYSMQLAERWSELLCWVSSFSWYGTWRRKKIDASGERLNMNSYQNIQINILFWLQ